MGGLAEDGCVWGTKAGVDITPIAASTADAAYPEYGGALVSLHSGQSRHPLSWASPTPNAPRWPVRPLHEIVATTSYTYAYTQIFRVAGGRAAWPRP